ncbi:unnamed protein product [Rotaria sp. Silwood2]|nr:unnamed protein product [Rotaria sp. Silwood2]CAF4179876.1 unnamed protein product [Rotaria sp. Silwood2]
MSIKIKSKLRSDLSTSNFYKEFILKNRHRIVSFHLPVIECTTEFFPPFTFDSAFIRLESIIINLTEPKILTLILKNLTCLPRLFSLTIDILKILEHLNDIYRLIFALSTLKYNKVIVHFKESSITLPIATDEEFGCIESLIIDHSCSSNELISLISYTPRLRHLTVCKTDNNDTNAQIFSLRNLINLESIYLDMFQITFHTLAIFLCKLSSNLKILSIASSNDINFLNAHLWENLISINFPQLEKFYLTYSDRFLNDNQYEVYHVQVNEFSSLFWIKRKWIFDVEIRFINIEYIVHPYNKRWYDDTDEINVNYSIEPCKLTGLTFGHMADFTFEGYMFKKIQRILTITQIFYLNILENHILTSVLIKLLDELPDLIVLAMHSLSFDKTKDSSVRTYDDIYSMRDKSKIKKVYIQEINNKKDFDFLCTFCPHMKYFKVKHINSMSIQLFLQVILKKISDDENIDVRALCFHMPLADDQIIQNLKTFITREQLLAQFTISRTFDHIYLRWD